MAGKSSIEAGRGHVTLAVDKSAMEKGLEIAKAEFQAWGNSIAAVGASIAAAGAAISAPFLYGLGVFSEWGKETKDGMRQTGLSFTEFDMLADGMRVSTDQLVPAIGKMSTFLESAAQGGAEANQSLSMLGTSMQELIPLSAGERALRLADAIASVGDASQRVALQREVFGRGGLALNIQGGRAGIQARSDRAEHLQGDALHSEKALRLAIAYNGAMRELKQVTTGIWASLGAAAAPVMTEVAQITTTILVGVRQWIDANRGVLTTVFRIADKMVLVGSIVAAVGGGLIVIGQGFGAMAGLFSRAASPVVFFSQIIWGIVTAGVSFVAAYAIPVAIVAALAVGIYLLYQNSESFAASINNLGGYLGNVFGQLGQIVGELGATFGQTFSGIIGALTSGQLELAGRVAFAGLSLAWVQAKGSLDGVSVGAVNTFISAWDTGVKWWIDIIIAAVKAIGSAITRAFGGIRMAWAEVVLYMQESWENLQNTINPMRSQEETDQNIAAARQQRDQAVSNIAADTEARIQRGNAAMPTYRDFITGIFGPSQNLVAGGNAAQMDAEKARRQEVARRQEELDRLMDDVMYQQFLASATPSEGGNGGFLTRGSSAGTFSAEALGYMQGGSDPMTAVERNTRDMRGLQQQILDRLRQMEGAVLT